VGINTAVAGRGLMFCSVPLPVEAQEQAGLAMAREAAITSPSSVTTGRVDSRRRTEVGVASSHGALLLEYPETVNG